MPSLQPCAASRISIDGQPSPSSRPNPSSAYQPGYGSDWVKCERRVAWRHRRDVHCGAGLTVLMLQQRRQLEADAPFDDEVAQLLDGANRDPEIIRQRVLDPTSRHFDSN